MAGKAAGFFGKLPAHGDFIYRDLPSGFINAWDNWLQGYVASSQEQIGEAWLDVYLTSPIWRFAFSEGVIDQHAWVGILLPSVDRVGRYFPFSIAKPLAPKSNPLDLISQSSWFEAIESAALQALEGRLLVDQLIQEINLPGVKEQRLYASVPAVQQKAAIVEMNPDEQPLSTAFPYLLDNVIRDQSPSYSVWATEGSERVDPCFFYTPALPKLHGIAALLDGQWRHWSWPEPTRLNLPKQIGASAEPGSGG